MTSIAVLDDYQGRARYLADWASLDTDITYFSEPIDDLASVLGNFEVLVLMRERTAFPREVLERLPRLKLVVTTGMANASLDVDFLVSQGVTVSGTGMGAPPPGGVPSTAEVAWALILAISKRVTWEDEGIRSGHWQLGMPRNLAGATLGLAGLGRLGGSMVAPARAFGMSVIAWSQNLTEERASELGVERVSKEALLERADVLSIHLVLSERTRGLFQAVDLARMKRDAVLINTSRGPIVDESALIDALKTRRIAAAGLDVFDHEPLPAGHELRSLDNTVVLPHLGYVSEAGLRSMYEQVVEDIAAYFGGHPLRTLSGA
jgi:phosphoglycerate dehydrogenase-like enzyme